MTSTSSRLTAFQGEISPRVADLHGSRDLSKIFGEGPKAPVPWKQVVMNKFRATYDPTLVKNELMRPITDEHGLTPVDPRHLQATQPHLVRAAVEHYMGDQFRTTGQTFADQHNVGNAYPFVYSRHREGQEHPDEVLLAGHHRAAAALLKGEPLMARRVQGGWGPDR